jgi:ribose transport system substrate-binding protein
MAPGIREERLGGVGVMLRRMVVLAGMVAVLGAGCRDEKSGTAGTQPARRARIALIMKAGTNPFFARMEEGARDAAKANDVDLLVMSLDTETDFEKQATHVETAVGQGVDAIVITPANSRALVPPLKRAQEAGILLINIDNRIDAETAEAAGLTLPPFIGPDNSEGAEQSTRELIRAIGGKGKIAMLKGVEGADNAEQRLKGFHRAVADHKDTIEVAAEVTADWDITKGQEKMSALLSTEPELDGVFCANDNMALGAIQAIESAGRTEQIVVTAFDNLQAAQAAIRDGKLHATIEQHPYLMGKWGVEQALQALGGKEIPDETPVPTDLVTAENLEEFGVKSAE